MNAEKLRSAAGGGAGPPAARGFEQYAVARPPKEEFRSTLREQSEMKFPRATGNEYFQYIKWVAASGWQDPNL